MSFYKHGKFTSLDKEFLANYANIPLPEPESLTALQEEQLQLLKEMYLEENKTAKEICQHFEVTHTPYIQKLFHKVFPKNMGWGGARKGSGNKKGYVFKKK